jgi:hypothetical protein
MASPSHCVGGSKGMKVLDMSLLTGVYNRKSLIPDNTILVASDHDFTKLFLTPSVILLCKIPTSISELFYHRKVYTLYKNIVFKPSSGIHHSTEFFAILSDHYFNSTEIPPIMCLYTDGEPDH